MFDRQDTDTFTLEPFIKFIEEQDPDREIKLVEAWEYCAVGDFCKTVDIDAIDYAIFLSDHYVELYYLLEAEVGIPTYGHLQRHIIRENPHKK